LGLWCVRASAAWVQLFAGAVVRAMDGCIVRRGIIS